MTLPFLCILSRCRGNQHSHSRTYSCSSHLCTQRGLSTLSSDFLHPPMYPQSKKPRVAPVAAAGPSLVPSSLERGQEFCGNSCSKPPCRAEGAGLAPSVLTVPWDAAPILHFSRSLPGSGLSVVITFIAVLSCRLLFFLPPAPRVICCSSLTQTTQLWGSALFLVPPQALCPAQLHLPFLEIQM